MDHFAQEDFCRAPFLQACCGSNVFRALLLLAAPLIRGTGPWEPGKEIPWQCLRQISGELSSKGGASQGSFTRLQVLR